MKSDSLRLCLGIALAFWVMLVGSFWMIDRSWMFLLVGLVSFFGCKAWLMLSLWVYWCCSPDEPVVYGPGLSPE